MTPDLHISAESEKRWTEDRKNIQELQLQVRHHRVEAWKSKTNIWL